MTTPNAARSRFQKRKIIRQISAPPAKIQIQLTICPNRVSPLCQPHAEKGERVPNGACDNDDRGQPHSQRQRRDGFERLHGDGQAINRRNRELGLALCL